MAEEQPAVDPAAPVEEPEADKEEEESTEVTYTPIEPFGLKIKNLDLKTGVDSEVINKLKEDVLKHKLLLFKGQGKISGERQLEITKWLGEVDDSFYNHVMSPHHEIFRVSNDGQEGCCNFGGLQWHIEGSFNDKPFAYALYHIQRVPECGGYTAFVDFEKLLDSMPEERKMRWESLSVVGGPCGSMIHPLVEEHPETKKKVLRFAMSQVGCFIWDYKSNHELITGSEETRQITKEICREIAKEDEALVYKHQWEAGDLIIIDNRSVAQLDSPESQMPPNKVGLRILHRTTVFDGPKCHFECKPPPCAAPKEGEEEKKGEDGEDKKGKKEEEPCCMHLFKDRRTGCSKPCANPCPEFPCNKIV